jgi:hypothetical protein
MKVTIRDPAVLHTVRPLEMVAYLRANGWHEVQRLERGAFWTKESGQEVFEVLVPLDAGLRDFPNRVADALQTLEQAEQRSQLEIVEDLTTTGADVIRPRLPGTNGDGAVSLERGMILHEQARDLMLAAACAAIEPRPLYAKRKPERAMQYLQHARFGLPTRGSYIMTIISPVAPKLVVGKNLFGEEIEHEEPFERRTVRTLAEALQAVAKACREVASTNELGPMKAAVKHGVSANLCEAIIGLDRGGGEKGVEFSFSWAPSRGVPVGIESVVSILPDSMPILEATARVFRETETVESSEVIGTVQKLEHQGGDQGKVTIVGTADGEPRTVHLELTGADHSLAVDAYEQRILVKCVGELSRVGRSWILRNPREFAVLAEAR